MIRHSLADATIERLALHPLLALSAVQVPVEGVLPESSLPISLFVAPAQLGALQGVAAVLRKAWTDLLRAAHCRGKLVSPSEAQPILEAMVRAIHFREPALSDGFYLIERPFSLRPRAPVQGDAIRYPLVALQLGLDRQGEAGVPFPVGEGRGLADCGRLLGLISGGAGPALIGAFLEESPDARRLWTRLVVGELLAAAPRERWLEGELPPGTVAHLGHATLLANLGGRFVLVDPWLPAASIGDRPPPPAPADLPRLDGIFFTHHHWDHVHAETLLQLDKRVPVFFPSQPAGRALTPRTDLLLRYLGFSDLRPLAHGESVAVGDGGQVTAAPFFGEDPSRIGYAGNCYVLGHRGAAALVHVDSATDADGGSLVSSGAARGLRDRFGPLSPVFATRRQELGAMVEYGWEGLLRPSSEWVRPTENCCNGPDDLAALCQATGARTLALYSEGGAPWFPEWSNFLATDGSPFHMPYQHLWDDPEAIARAAAQAGAEMVRSQPYRRFRIGAGSDGSCAPRADAGSY